MYAIISRMQTPGPRIRLLGRAATYGMLCIALVTNAGCRSGPEVDYGALLEAFMQAEASQEEFARVVTDDVNLWGDYKHAGVYITLTDVFLLEASGCWRTDLTQGSALALVPPNDERRLGLMLFSAPKSTERFDPEKWTNVLGVIPTGTKFRTTTLIEHGVVDITSSLDAYAAILNGEFSGSIVNITDLSDILPFDVDSPDPLLKGPDLRILAPVRTE